MPDIQPAVAFLSSSLILTAAVGLTGLCLWIGSRLTPWFLKEAIAAPTVRTLLLSDDELEVSMRVRIAACGLSVAVMLAALLTIVVASRVVGWAPNT